MKIDLQTEISELEKAERFFMEGTTEYNTVMLTAIRKRLHELTNNTTTYTLEDLHSSISEALPDTDITTLCKIYALLFPADAPAVVVTEYKD